ncbi:unnamed protein product [Adineta steineri]|uniref:N-acetyltransferase domain-containing protein n=2 Tax=Adineta steineri TaxID=433720 RepID=A0A814BN63_9BILA|nr:unnamed protein product [Adineta steineri]
MINDEYVYEVINNETTAYICAQLLAEEFCAHNPITVFDQITSKCFFEECAWPLMKDMMDEGLSFLARHRSSKEIVGAVIAGDLYTYHQRHPYDSATPPQAIAASDLLDEMENLFIIQDFGRALKPNLVLHITLAAVCVEHSGRGVASQMNMAMCDYARNTKGFQYALVQITNQVTRHIFVSKMKGKEVTTIDPTVWLWKKKDDGLLCPYKGYTHGLIPNILIDLNADNEI